MVNLIDTARSFLTPEMVSRLSGASGLGTDTGAGAIGSMLPVLLAGVGNIASTPAGAGVLMQELASARLGGGLLDSLTGAGGTDLEALATQGAPIINMLFGSAAAPASDAVARFTGAQPGAISRLMAMLAPIALSLVSRQLSAGGGSGPAAITRLFASERAGILEAIPAGLRSTLAAIPGLGFLSATAAAAPVAAMPQQREEDRGGGIGAILPWLLLLAGLAALVWWLTREKPETVTTTTTTVQQTIAEFEEATITATIPEGVTMLTADSAMTTEQCNAAFREALAGATIEFDTAASAIREEAKPVLDTLAGVAGRCSGYKVTVEGHTDLQGSQATNLPLSRDRALEVAHYLVAKGVNPAQLRAIGYGESRPKEAVAGADQVNRRIELTVTQ